MPCRATSTTSRDTAGRSKSRCSMTRRTRRRARGTVSSCAGRPAPAASTSRTATWTKRPRSPTRSSRAACLLGSCASRLRRAARRQARTATRRSFRRSATRCSAPTTTRFARSRGRPSALRGFRSRRSSIRRTTGSFRTARLRCPPSRFKTATSSRTTRRSSVAACATCSTSSTGVAPATPRSRARVASSSRSTASSATAAGTRRSGIGSRRLDIWPCAAHRSGDSAPRRPRTAQ